MGVEREDTQLRPSLVWAEIRLWPPRPPHVLFSLSMCDYRLFVARPTSCTEPQKKKKKKKISVSKLIMTGCNFYSGWDEHYFSHTFMSEVGEVSGNSRECIQVVQYMVSGGNWDRWRRRRHLWTVFTGFFPVQDVSFLCLFQLDPWCQTQLMFFLQVFLGLACGVLDSAAYYKQTWVCKAFVIIQDSQALMSSGLFVHLAVDNLQISLQLNSCRSECFVIALTSFWSGGSLCRVLSVEFIDPNQP